MRFAVAHIAYFGFMSEMEDPRTFNKSLAMLQIIDTVLYLISALLIYHYVGPDVESPAILSLSPLMSKIAWGLAIPTVSLPLSFHLCYQSYADLSRSFSPVLSWVTLRASTSTSAFSVVPTRCTAEASFPLEPGLPSVSASGSSHGLSRNRSPCSMTCSVSL